MATYYTAFFANQFDFQDDANTDLAFTDVGFSPQTLDHRLDLTQFRLESCSLSAAESRTVDAPVGAATAKSFIWARVEGSVTVTLTGKDSDGTTTITSSTRVFGTSKWPGFFEIHAQNVSAVSLTAAASSTVHLIWGTFLEPNDPLLG
jgi:hypothetical protein